MLVKPKAKKKSSKSFSVIWQRFSYVSFQKVLPLLKETPKQQTQQTKQKPPNKTKPQTQIPSCKHKQKSNPNTAI